jgi:hypothetical protein
MILCYNNNYPKIELATEEEHQKIKKEIVES